MAGSSPTKSGRRKKRRTNQAAVEYRSPTADDNHEKAENVAHRGNANLPLDPNPVVNSRVTRSRARNDRTSRRSASPPATRGGLQAVNNPWTVRNPFTAAPATANQPSNRAPTLTAPDNGVVNALVPQPVNPFRKNLAPATRPAVRMAGDPQLPNPSERQAPPAANPAMVGFRPANTYNRPVATPSIPTQTQAQLLARITELEDENVALRYDNAALGVTVAESNNIPRNDRDALLNLVRTTNIPRGTLIRLRDNNDFLER